MPDRLTGWWRGLGSVERRHATALAIFSLIYVGHYLVFCIPQPFYIEDAGITFAFARNLVEGDGLVPWMGGERIEGYSNPLWTFLIAGLYALGMPTWTSSKIMGAVFGVITLPLAYAIVRRARPPRPDGTALSQDVALLAPLLLAVNPQFVIWNASGLENSLFCVLLAAAVYRLLVEDERPGSPFPWSALWFMLLSMTRPEGIMYAAIGAGVALVSSLSRRRVLPFVAWLAVFTVPFAAYNAWRYEYFAWPLPNTYYAKEAGEKAFQPYSWTNRGWKYIKNYLINSGTLFALPVLVVGLTGLGGWRGRGWGRSALALGVLAVLAGLIAWDGRAGLPHLPPWWRPIQTDWVKIRVWSIGVAAVLLGVATLTRPGWRARGILWASCSAAVFFVLYSGGDWMKAFRWFNIVSVLLMPLLAIGLGEIVDALPALARPLPAPARLAASPWAALWTGRTLVIAVPFLAYAGVGAWQSNRFAIDPETAVRDVRRRVDYMTWVQRRLDIDHVTLVDVDMGAHMYFSGWHMVDIAGLVDIPIARHRTYDKKFMREYLFEEKNPEFAHVHAGWARTSKIPQHKEWKERYLEIPGYPTGATALHVGNHVRRDLFIDALDEPAAALARFAGGVDLVTVEVPSPVVAPGGDLYIHTAWQSDPREDGFRILTVLESEGEGGWRRSVSVLPPGYDWYRPEEWKRGEVVHGRQRMAIPEDLPQGTYQLSFVLLDEKSGEVLRLQQADEADPQEAAPAPAGPEATPYFPGGWRVPVEVKVVGIPEATAEADADLQAAVNLAAEGACEEAWPRWKDATRHVMKNTAWQEKNKHLVKREISACYVSRAANAATDEEKALALVAGNRYDFRYEPLREAARALGEVYEARGDALAADEDWERAYQAWHQALLLEPQLSWARRKAEDARDRRLGIGAYTPKPGVRPPARADKKDKPAVKTAEKPKVKAEDVAGADEAEAPEVVGPDEGLPAIGGGP